MQKDPFRLIGTTLGGKYRVDRLIGEGGFGVVYAGEHTALRQPVAIKCMKGVAEGAGKFLREARLLFNLTHPNIVRMYDAGEHAVSGAGIPYVVLELVEGRPLEEEINQRRARAAPPLSPHEIAGIFSAVLEALAYAHAQSVVHRDLKPSNVMVTRGPSGVSAKILDFGTANAQTRSHYTQGIGITPRYAAPEQWDESIAPLGPHTDIFSVGLMLEEAITTARLVDGASIPELVDRVMSPARGSRIGQLRPDMPRALEEVVIRATRVRPEERFPDARAMEAALHAALGLSAPAPVSAGPRSLSQRAPVTQAKPPSGDSKAAWLGCFFVPLVALLIVIGAIVWLVLEWQKRS